MSQWAVEGCGIWVLLEFHPSVEGSSRVDIPTQAKDGLEWATRLNDVHPVIEVVRCSERAGPLDSSAEGIVLEGCRATVGAGYYGLHYPIFEVPGEAAALVIGEGIAVCVYCYPQHGSANGQRRDLSQAPTDARKRDTHSAYQQPADPP